MRCHGLAHGRRQFSALEALLPVEGQVVIEALTQVCEHDEEARDKQMNAEERLAYHPMYSAPRMDQLKGWLEQPGTARLVEPNSSLGQARASLLGRWATLTRF